MNHCSQILECGCSSQSHDCFREMKSVRRSTRQIARKFKNSPKKRYCVTKYAFSENREVQLVSQVLTLSRSQFDSHFK